MTGQHAPEDGPWRTAGPGAAQLPLIHALHEEALQLALIMGEWETVSGVRVRGRHVADGDGS